MSRLSIRVECPYCRKENNAINWQPVFKKMCERCGNVFAIRYGKPIKEK